MNDYFCVLPSMTLFCVEFLSLRQLRTVYFSIYLQDLHIPLPLPL